MTTQQKKKLRLLLTLWAESNQLLYPDEWIWSGLVVPAAAASRHGLSQTGSWPFTFTINVSEATLAHQFFHRICCKRRRKTIKTSRIMFTAMLLLTVLLSSMSILISSAEPCSTFLRYSTKSWRSFMSRYVWVVQNERTCHKPAEKPWRTLIRTLQPITARSEEQGWDSRWWRCRDICVSEPTWASAPCRPQVQRTPAAPVRNQRQRESFPHRLTSDAAS